MPKIIKIGLFLTELFKKLKCERFLGHSVIMAHLRDLHTFGYLKPKSVDFKLATSQVHNYIQVAS